MTGTAQAKPPGVFATLKATPSTARYLLLGVLLNQLGAFVQPFLVIYLVERGLAEGQAGLALAAYSAGAVAGTLVGGELTQRLGARTTIAAAMASSGMLIGSVPWLSTPDLFWALLAVVCMAGAVTQASRPASAALLSDLMPGEHQVMGFSMMRIAMNIGAALGPLLAAGFILVNWNLLFWFDGVTAFVYAGLALLFLPRLPRPEPAAVSTDDAASRSGYGVVFRNGRFLLYLASMLLSAVVYVQFFTVLPLKISAEGHPTALYSAVLATSSGILIVCELAVTSLVRRWLPAIAVGIGTSLMGLGLAAYGLSSSSAAAIILATVVIVSGLMISGPTMFAHPAKAPAHQKGRFLGASQATFGLGSALGPALGVMVWGAIGNDIWLICGVIGLIAAACAVAGVHRQWEPVPDTTDPAAAT